MKFIFSRLFASEPMPKTSVAKLPPSSKVTTPPIHNASLPDRSAGLPFSLMSPRLPAPDFYAIPEAPHLPVPMTRWWQVWSRWTMRSMWLSSPAWETGILWPISSSSLGMISRSKWCPGRSGPWDTFCPRSQCKSERSKIQL